MDNYFWARERQDTGCTWVRPSELLCEDALLPAALPRPLVHCNGVFDLLHSSHMRLLSAARRKASKTGTLVVTMDSDRMVRGKKGPSRPILTWIERAASLAHCGVDYLIEIDSDEEYERVVRALSPDLLVTGSDKLSEPDRFPEFPSMIVRDLGMRTSEIIARCARSAERGRQNAE